MYFVDIAATSGAVSCIELVPLGIKQFKLVPASAGDIEWLQHTLNRESRQFATSVVVTSPGHLTARSDAGEIDSHQ